LVLDKFINYYYIILWQKKKSQSRIAILAKIKVKAKEEKQPTNNETKGNVTTVKEKMKMKPQVMEETITKINLDSPVENTEVNRW
jgi:hypothetical protein